MRRLLFIILFLCLPKIALAVPSNTLSIVPVAVDGATITASDENTRNNTTVSIYNAHTHTDISQTASTLNVGDALVGNKTITANNADANKPYLKYDDTNNYWIFSTDGVASSAVLRDEGLIFEGDTDNASQTTLTITDPTADRTITIPNSSGTVVLSAPTVAQTVDLSTNTTVSAMVATSITGLTTLTASGNLDIGTFSLTANTFVSDVATGTAPLTVSSTTVVSNLNADTIDGLNSTNFIRAQLFTSTGTFTTPAGVSKVWITMVGGGGGGGGNAGSGTGGGGGGAGAWIIRGEVGVVATTEYTVTVGAGGTSPAGNQNSTAGGNSSFAGVQTLTTNGGTQGECSVCGGGSGGGAGGTASGAYAASGATAGTPVTTVGGAGANGAADGGGGGGNPFGRGGAGKTDAGNGNAATGYGAGGGGVDAGQTVLGGAGSAGFCLVEW